MNKELKPLSILISVAIAMQAWCLLEIVSLKERIAKVEVTLRMKAE